MHGGKKNLPEGCKRTQGNGQCSTTAREEKEGLKLARCGSEVDAVDDAILRLKIGLDKRTSVDYTYKEDMHNLKKKVAKLDRCVKKLIHYG